jgi:hypothetical protein
MFLLNALSLSMVPEKCDVRVRHISKEDARAELLAAEWDSAVGHANTAAVFSSVLGIDVPVNRISVKVEAGARMIVGQYVGPRLPEGATELPEGAEVRWVLVTVHDDLFYEGGKEARREWYPSD